MTETTQNQQRGRKRAEMLRVLVRERGLPDVLAAAEKLWSNGHAPNEIRIRTLYARNPNIPDVDLWAPFPIPAQLRFGPELDERKRPASHILPPMARLIVSQGVALQFHLTALFAAHCQSRPGRAWDNQIPLSRRTPDSVNWLDLVAVSAKSSGSSAQASAYTRNKLRQFRSALGLLARNHIVDLGKPASVNRYEGFRLLSEDASSSSVGAIEYRVPRGDEDTLKIPFQFFTRGWVHVLTKSEIAAFLMCLQLASEEDYLSISWKERAGLFGLSRDVYDATQALEAYRLINIMRPRGRREDGTWRGFSSGGQPFSNKIRLNLRGLWRPAHEVVEAAVMKTAVLGKWSRPLGG